MKRLSGGRSAAMKIWTSPDSPARRTRDHHVIQFLMPCSQQDWRKVRRPGEIEWLAAREIENHQGFLEAPGDAARPWLSSIARRQIGSSPFADTGA